MTDKLELEARQRRANAATVLLDDEMFKGAVQSMRDKAFTAFKSAHPDDHVALSTARIRYQVTEDFFNEFAKIVRSGVKATNDLEALKDKPPGQGR